MKTVLKVYFYICFMVNTTCIYGQSERIDTILINEKHIGQGNFVAITPFSTFRSDDSNKAKYKGMPDEIDTFRLDFIPFDVQQYYFDRLKRGKISQEVMIKKFKNDIDTLILSKDYIKHQNGVFSGLKGKNKIVIVDANNNYDFFG